MCVLRVLTATTVMRAFNKDVLTFYPTHQHIAAFAAADGEKRPARVHRVSERGRRYQSYSYKLGRRRGDRQQPANPMKLRFR